MQVTTETRSGKWDKVPTSTTAPYWEVNKAKSSDNFVGNPEGMTMWVDHAAFAPSIGIYGSSRDSKGKMVDASGALIRDLKGTKDTITLGDLLKAVDRNLDYASLSKLHLGKRAREVGMVIAVEIFYTNLNSGLGSPLIYTMKPRLLPGVNFRQDETTSQSSQDTRVRWQRNGVRIVFLTQGQVGIFDSRQFLVSLVAGFALLAVATTMVDVFATRLIPQRETYYDCKYQQVELEYDDDHDGMFGSVQGVKVHGIRVGEHGERITRGGGMPRGGGGYMDLNAAADAEAAGLTDTEEDPSGGVDMQDRQCI